MNNTTIDIIIHISTFLQRTDQIALKLCCKNCIKLQILMTMNEELNLYGKNISKLDYAWQNDKRYYNILEVDTNMDLYKHIAIITNLWYFDINGYFNVYPDNYMIIVDTNVNEFDINLEFDDGNSVGFIDGFINRRIINFNRKGKLKINCREIKKFKNNKLFRLIMCIPVYYYNKMKYIKI